MQSAENYTPGYTSNASEFMARRSVATHAAFLLPHIRTGIRVLDCGCGPGSVTCDFARRVSPGHVTGIDREPSQIALARKRAGEQGITNAAFESASIYELPFADATFDVAFAHAVFEHLSSPVNALRELLRVLKPGGIVALRSPDWGGFIVGPDAPDIRAAVAHYMKMQNDNGGDVLVGRKFPALLREAGFASRRFSATYECYEPASVIGEYLALQLDAAGCASEAAAFRSWSADPDAVFAQAWCEIIGTRE